MRDIVSENLAPLAPFSYLSLPYYLTILRHWFLVSKVKYNYLPELTALALGRKRPSMVTVNLTSKCDQHCIYCEIGRKIPSSHMDKLNREDIEWIIDEMAATGIKRISFCGGEPFLFPEIISIVEYAGEKNIRCTITTNGMKAFKMSRKDLRILKENNALINISIDSFDESLQDHIRGKKNSLVNPLRSIEVFSEYGIPVTVLTVISKYNYENLYDIFVTACDKRIKQILFQPVISFSNYPDRAPVPEKSRINVPPKGIPVLMENLRRMHKYEKTHNINTNIYRIMPWIKNYLETPASGNGKWFFDDVVKKFYCREVDAIIDITYDGGIQPCGLALSSVTIHSNREKGLLALWEEATHDLRSELNNNKFREICNGCCHHFSRNLLASVIRFPVTNRKTLFTVGSLILNRIAYRTYKKLLYKT